MKLLQGGSLGTRLCAGSVCVCVFSTEVFEGKVGDLLHLAVDLCGVSPPPPLPPPSPLSLSLLIPAIQVGFSDPSYNVDEGNTTSVELTVVANPLNRSVTVNVTSVDGTATG